MKFIHTDLGYQQRGSVVEVTLSGNAANVRLLDSSNFQNYRNGRQHHYYGGLMRRSPARIPIPNSGHWHVAIDMQGLGGQTRASVRLIPAAALSPLPEYSAPSLSRLVRPVAPEVPDNFANDTPVVTTGEYDVFISHATEDKNEIVRRLANALVAENLRVWYDEFELRIGQSLRRKIDHGLAKSRLALWSFRTHSFQRTGRNMNSMVLLLVR